MLLFVRAAVIIAMAARGVSTRSGVRMSDTDFAEYDSKVTFMFPGQGAQYMGMAASVYEEVCMCVQRRGMHTDAHVYMMLVTRRDIKYTSKRKTPEHSTRLQTLKHAPSSRFQAIIRIYDYTQDPR